MLRDLDISGLPPKKFRKTPECVGLTLYGVWGRGRSGAGRRLEMSAWGLDKSK